MSAREPEAPVTVGDVLAGKYRVERVLGAGGMGVVVEATHLELDERVALKFLLPEALENAEAAARFVREARAVVRIKSEHVVRVSDVGRLESGAPYIVMEYLEGRDLSALIDEGTIPAADVVDYVLQACLAMTDAHALGIVHRDLKPSNLFLTRRTDGSPIVKVLDFGISKVISTDRPDPALTKTAVPMGSPYYMSPEQLRSARDVDHRTDVWALGVILFEMFTQMPPFQAESMPQLVAAVLVEPPMALDKLRPDLPAELCAVVNRCLEKDPAKRFQDVSDLAHALMPFAPARSGYIRERLSRTSSVSLERAPTIPAPADTLSDRPSKSDVSGARTNAAWTETQRGGGGSRRNLVLAAGGAAIALGVVFVATRGGENAPSDAVTPSAVAPGVAPVATAPTAPTSLPVAPPVVAPAPFAAPDAPLVAPVVAAGPSASAAVAASASSRARTASTSGALRTPGARVEKRPAAVAAKTSAPPAPPPQPSPAAPPPAPAPVKPKNPLSVDIK